MRRTDVNIDSLSSHSFVYRDCLLAVRILGTRSVSQSAGCVGGVGGTSSVACHRLVRIRWLQAIELPHIVHVFLCAIDSFIWLWYCQCSGIIISFKVFLKNRRIIIMLMIGWNLMAVNSNNVAEFTTRFCHLVGFSTIFLKPAVCCIMPACLHTPLPQHPAEVEQLSSRSRTHIVILSLRWQV